MMLALIAVSPGKQVSLGKLPTSQPRSNSCKSLHPKSRACWTQAPSAQGWAFPARLFLPDARV